MNGPFDYHAEAHPVIDRAIAQARRSGDLVQFAFNYAEVTVNPRSTRQEVRVAVERQWNLQAAAARGGSSHAERFTRTTRWFSLPRSEKENLTT